MPVGVERDVRLRVSEPPAHSEYVFAFGNQDRGVGVSQAVKLAPGTPALRQALYQARVTLLGDSNSPSMVCSTSFSNPAHPTTRNRFADPGQRCKPQAGTFCLWRNLWRYIQNRPQTLGFP